MQDSAVVLRVRDHQDNAVDVSKNIHSCVQNCGQKIVQESK